MRIPRPHSNSHDVRVAQRRRQTTPRTRTQAPARPPRVTSTPEAAPARAQPSPQPTRRAEPELSVEELLAADSYTVYLEVRRVGTLARAEELKSAVASLTPTYLATSASLRVTDASVMHDCASCLH